MADVTIWLRDYNGGLLKPDLAVTRAEWTLEENKFGVLRVVGPLAEVDPSLFIQDVRLEVKRSIDGGPYYVEGDAPFLLRFWDFGKDESGLETYSLEAYSPEYVLTGRIIDSYASTETITNPLTTKTGAADDLAKAFVREAIAELASTLRTVNGFYVDENLGEAPSTTISCSYDNLWDVLTDLAEDSLNQGTYMTYAVQYKGTGSKELIFRTFTGQRGTYHSGAGAIIASEELGNLRSARVSYDYRDAINCVRAAGKGEGAARMTVRVEDTKRSRNSPYSYREGLEDDTGAETAAALTAAARAELQRGRAMRTFTGELQDTENSRYGQSVNFGDTLRAKYLGFEMDVRLNRVRGVWDKESGEVLEIGLEGTEAL